MTRNTVARVRLTPKEQAALQSAADKWGITISDALRWAIRAQYMTPHIQPQETTGPDAPDIKIAFARE